MRREAPQRLIFYWEGSKKRKKIVGGSDVCRVALWQWLFTKIEVKGNRPINDAGKAVSKIVDDMKDAGRPIRLIRMTAIAKATKLLFKDLVDILNQNNRQFSIKRKLPVAKFREFVRVKRIAANELR